MSGSDRERTWFEEGIEKNPSWYTDEDPEEELEDEEEVEDDQPQRKRKQSKKDEEEEEQEEQEEKENTEEDEESSESENEDADSDQTQDTQEEQDKRSTDDDADSDFDDDLPDQNENQNKKDTKDKKDTSHDTDTPDDSFEPSLTPDADDLPKDSSSPHKNTKEAAESAKEKAKDAAEAVKDKAKTAVDATKAALTKAAEAIKAAAAKIAELLAPYIGWILLALLIIIVIIILIFCVVAAVGVIASKLDPANMINNEYLTSEYFYGRRIVYIDDDALANSLELSYKQYVVDVITNFEDNNPNVDITITLPELNGGVIADNSIAIGQHISNLSLGIANIVANNSNDYVGVDFATLYPLINYFGFSDGQHSSVANFIADYIVLCGLYSTSESVDMLSLIKTTIDTDADLQYMHHQYEKVMIKDEIASKDGLADVAQRQYVASIYMPNTNIEITRVTYTLVNENEEFDTSIKLIELNNGSEKIHLDNGLKNDNTSLFNGFTIGKVSLNRFESIDVSNISRFSSGLSLFEAVKSLPSDTECFKQDAETGTYSWKPLDSSVLYLEFEANNKFIYSEFDIAVKLPK